MATLQFVLVMISLQLTPASPRNNQFFPDDFDDRCEVELKCDFIATSYCVQQTPCMNKTSAIKNGFANCSSPNVFTLIPFGTHVKINMHKLYNKTECSDIGFHHSDNFTCYEINYLTHIDKQSATSRAITCRSSTSDEQYSEHELAYFHCSDNSHIFLDHFCDGIKDCVDGSDEIKNQPGFKCNECVLLQNNLYGELAQCNDCSDLCLLANNSFCFQCLDKRLHISSTQVCNGEKDCFDSSDECLCDKNIGDKMCNNLFDSKNFSCFETNDQNYLKHSSLKIHVTKKTSEKCSKAYENCDAIQAFPFNSRPEWCSNDFLTNDNLNKKEDNDEEDDCDEPDDIVSDHFSSKMEMIANPGLRNTFWVVGILVLIGNAYVILSSIALIKAKKLHHVFKLQHIIILNISIADFIMGVYLLTIASFSAKFSGRYGCFDREWRSSIECFVIGSLSMISSETSCFLMVVLTAFRLRNISQPMRSLNFSLLPWKISVAAIWLLSLCLCIIPMLRITSSYFVHTISLHSSFFQNKTTDIARLNRFMCSYAVLSNKTIKVYGNALETIEMFFENNIPYSAPVRMFGYYGATSVCLPRFYVERGEPAWEYTVSLITINFLRFFFIAISYVLIYKRSFKFSEDMDRNGPDKDATAMQRRITRIVVTDFCCWIPICIMAYLRLGGVKFTANVYQITAALLLPINSALNPFLFSSLPDKLINLFHLKLLNLRNSS